MLRCQMAGAFVMLAVAGPPAGAQPASDSALNRLLAAIPDSQARRFWREAARSSSVIGVAALLAAYDRPITQRRIPQLRLTAAQASAQGGIRPPRIPDTTLAAVVPFSTHPIGSYQGRFVVREAVAGRLTGSIDSIAQPFELYYKLPENRALPNIAPGSVLQLQLFEDSFGMTRRRRVLLTSGRDVLLWFFSDGAESPYQLRLESPPINLVQRVRDPRAVPSVDFSLGGQSAVSLTPRQRTTINWQGRRYEVVVLEAAVGPASPRLEADRYHVTVLLYALPDPR